MKRGFLNTARSKRVVEEAYAPQLPPSGRHKPPECPKTPSLVPHPGDSDPNKPAAALTDDAMDVNPADGTQAVTTLQEVYADGHVVAVRVTRSTNAEGAAENQTTELQDVYADSRIVGVRVIRSTTGAEKMLPESRKNGHSTQAEPHHATKDPKGKGKEKADTDDTTNTPGHNPRSDGPPRLLHRYPPGWGRHPDEEFFHTVPPAYAEPHRKRGVFRVWPRDPKGKPIEPSDDRRGTLSPDGYPWGATLYDIFLVERLPNVPNFVSVVTGSAIREAVEEMGELDAAAPEIEWAKSEGKPRVEGAASTEEIIRCLDMKRRIFSFLDVQKETEKEQDGGQDTEDIAEQARMEEDGGEGNGIPTSSPTMLPTSPLRPNHGPKRCSFIPFKSQPQILLQERIPLYLLPQTLRVHDPFNLLTAGERQSRNTSWTSRPDIVRTHNLRLSETVREKCEDARRKAEELEEFKARTLIVLRYQRTKEQIKNNDPVIEVLLPPYLRRPTKVEESHLYLSPVAKVGKGHHSIVYKGEWELPRNIFMKEKICSLCFQKSVDEEVQRLKETGRWEKMLRAASWGPNGFTGRQAVQAELDEVNDPPNMEKEGEIIEREITCVVLPDADPSNIVERIDRTDAWDRLMEKKGEINVALLHFALGDGGGRSSDDSGAAVIRINPPFSYETQKSCTHDWSHGPVPRTAMFTVIAKLSLEDDPHLAREANNYQMFPERFFEHYNGYTVMSQLHAIVPVNAVVPQFYGYYVPETSKTKGEPPYLSPILLLEHCGKPIDPEELSNEDQEECVSLLLRFQRAGWLHESVAPRNFLVQHGKPTEFPLVRKCKPELSFRLIDFGRSRKYDRVDEKRREEGAALGMFSKLVETMGVSLGSHRLG